MKLVVRMEDGFIWDVGESLVESGLVCQTPMNVPILFCLRKH